MTRPRRVLVVTNGEVTEKQYCDLLNEIEDAKPRGERAFHIVCKTKPVDPANLVSYALTLVEKDRRASERKNGGSSEPYALVYVVVDVDDYLARNSGNLRKAQRMCSNKGICLIISDPCFEVWLLDHVMMCPSHVTNQYEAEALAKSKGLTTGRDNKYFVTKKLHSRVGIAVKNAERHNVAASIVHRKSLQGTSFAPWTDFPDLVKGVGAVKHS